MNQIQKMAIIRSGDSEMTIPKDPEAQKAYPLLWDWMTSVKVGEYIRDPCALSIRMGVQSWSVSLRDDTLKMSLETQAETLQDAFAALELSLASPRPPWRSWKGQEPVLRKKKRDEKKD